MATVKIDKFGGIAPRQHPTQLADGMATVAMNVKLESGKLVPLREPKIVRDASNLMENGLDNVADAKSVHVWRKKDGSFDFLLFPGVTWAAPGNVADDDLTRLVVSGDRSGNGTATEPVVYMRTGTTVKTKTVVPIIKTPLPAPKVTRTGEAALGDDRRYTRFFWSWVDAYGMESPVSPPSLVLNPDYDNSNPDSQEYIDADLEYNDGDTISFAAFGTGELPSEAALVRVYKVVAGTEEGHVQFVAEFLRSAAAGGLAIAKSDADASEAIPEIEAPFADLCCITDVPGAFYVGFSPLHPKTVCFSEVDLLYSWPEQYRYDIADNIVALAVTSNSVFALTDGWPYVLTGTAPESMTVAKLASPAACVSPRGVCVMRNTVFFASNAGLMAIANSATEGTVVTNLTEQIFTKEQWQALNPASCLLGHHNGRLFMYFTLSDGTHRGLTFNFADGLSVALTEHDEAAACLCVDNREDKMYYVREGV